jgi:ABC-2 type transport system ATP-binding protein
VKILIEICDVSKSIDESKILSGINLEIKEGSIMGLVGPNGAGKTSIIKILTGSWKADEGFVKFDGKDVFDNPEVKAKIGYVPDFCHYYESYRVKEIVRFIKLAYTEFSEKRYDELNNIFRVSPSKRISGISKGTKTKLMLMLSLSVMPRYLILDEPTSGLDALAKRKFVEVMLDEVAERKTTVLISTHNLADVEQICDSIAVINSGAIKFWGTVDEMKQKVRKLQVIFEKGVSENILGCKEILSVKNVGSVYHVVTKDYCDEFKKKLKNNGATLVEEIDLSLEEIFIYSLGGEKVYDEITK